MSYVISLGVGLIVGIAYALIGVRSPAPPLVALAGLLGMVGGEQLVPLVKHWVMPERAVVSSSNPASVASDRTTAPQ
jgi:XapX domain-containing protein